MPLTEQREALTREIQELKAVRDVFLAETTVLNVRNEELAQLSAQYARRMQSVPESDDTSSKNPEFLTPRKPTASKSQPHFQQATPTAYLRPATANPSSDDSGDSRLKTPRAEIELPTPSKGKFWRPTRSKEAFTTSPSTASDYKGKNYSEHNFQQLSILRFTRCDQCQEKMWGSQLRCSSTLMRNSLSCGLILSFVVSIRLQHICSRTMH